MRKILVPALVLSGLAIAWSLNHAVAATGVADPTSLYHGTLHSGDDVRLMLTGVPSGTEDSVSGTLTGFDENTFEVAGEVQEMVLRGKVVGTEHRKVIFIVPRTNVIRVEKTISKEFQPSTQP